MSAGICTNVRQAVYEKTLNSMSPGPVYEKPSGIGKQSESTKNTAPSWSMGGRHGHDHASDTPGPDAYGADQTTIGRQTLSNRQTAASWGFGTSPRKSLERTDNVPSPDRYNIPEGFGSNRPKTADSRRRNAPAWSLGTGGRDSNHPHDGPGPGQYTSPQGIGPQALSTRPTSARAKFGTSKRPDLRTSDAPPPNTYNPSTYTRILSSSLLSFPSHFI